MIESRLALKKNTFACFVDLSKAYDRINRDLLWKKLFAYGINNDNKIMKALKAIYEKVKCNVRINGMKTQWFDVTVGLKQGCIWSPLLFNMYINDLCIEMKATGKGLNIGEETLCILLFADDLVLLAENEEDLQLLLNVMSEWCKKWKLLINGDKTNIVHFRSKGSDRSKCVFTCGDVLLSYKDRYRYLGLWLTEHMDYDFMAKEVSKAAHRALGLIIAKSKVLGGMPFETFTTLYNACVLPVITYGAAIWGQKQYSCIDAVHNRACRYYLGVNRYTPNAAIHGDMGWKLPYQHQWIQVTKQWVRMCNMDRRRLTKRVFLWAHDIASRQRKKNWVSRCIKFYKDLHTDHLTQIDTLVGVDWQPDMEKVLFDQTVQSWQADVTREEARHGSGRNKLRTYRTFKHEFETEHYVKQIMPYPFRSALAKFRCGVAPIRIETGRYGHNRLPENQRFCFNCQTEVEDEFHVLMFCPLYNDLRNELVHRAELAIPDYHLKMQSVQFQLLLSHEKIVNVTAKTLCHILQRHTALFSQ